MPILILAMTESVCILEEDDDNNRSEEEAKVPTLIIVPIESVTRNKKGQRSYNGNSNSDSQTAIDFLTPQLLFRYQISRKEVVIWAINKMEADEVFQELPKDIQKTLSGI